MSLSNGLLNLTNWLGNVIMQTMAGLFAAAAIHQFSKNRHHHQFAYAALASLMCSGLLRARLRTDSLPEVRSRIRCV